MGPVPKVTDEAGRRFDAAGLIRTLSHPGRLVDRLALAVALGPPRSKGGRRLPGRGAGRRLAATGARGVTR